MPELDPRTSLLTTADIEQLALRLAAASRGHKYRPRFQTDLVLASRLLATLIRTGVIAGPVDMGGRDG